MEKESVPILGIEHEEHCKVTDTTQTRVLTYGPCDDCGGLRWLSHRNSQHICSACWYGPMWDGPDPVVDDIRHHLGSAFYHFKESIPEGAETIEVTEEHHPVVHLLCPQCSEEVSKVTQAVFGQLACDECIEQAREEVLA